MKLTMRAQLIGKKFTLIFTAYVLAVSSLTASVPFIFAQKAAAASSVTTVSASGSGGWVFYDDNTDLPDHGLGSFVSGPATAPLGAGSAQLSVSGTERKTLATYQFAGTALSDISGLGFSTYNSSAGNGGAANRSAYLNFNVDFDGSDSWQRRLIFLPSDNGTVVQNTWQQWDAVQGGAAKWRYSFNGGTWPGTSIPSETPRTWSDLLSSYPGISIRATDAFVGLRVGEPYQSGYTENIDRFYINVAGNERIFDFDPQALITNADAYFTAGGTYTGIGVDFTVQDVVDATGIELRVNRTDGTTYSATAKQVLVDSINAGGTQTRSGTVVISGARTSDNWNDQVGIWKGHTLPESVDVIVTRANGNTLTLRSLISTNKATWLQVKPIDITKPQVSVSLSELVINQADALANNNPLVTVTATDAQSGVDYVEYKIMDEDGDSVRGWTVVPNGVATATNNVVGLADGTYTLRARAFDHDGNKNSGNDITFTVDKTAPAAPVLLGDAVRYMAPGSAVFTWAKSTSDDVTHYVYYNEASGFSQQVPFDASKGTYSLSLPTGPGSRVLSYHITAVDAAGNTSQSAATHKVYVDDNAPVVTVSNEQVSADKKLSFDFRATDAGGAGLKVVAANIYNAANTGSPLIQLGSGNPKRLNTPHEGFDIGTVHLFETTLSNIDVSGLAPGTYTIRAFARDGVNRETTITKQFVVAPNEPSILAASATSIAGKAGAGLKVEIVVDGDGDVHQTTADGAGDWFFDFTPQLVPGKYNIRVTAIEGASNRSDEVSYTLVVSAPVTEVVNNTGNTPAPAPDAPLTNFIANIFPDAGNQQSSIPDAETESEASTLGASDEAKKTLGAAVNNTDGNAMGLVWYWWLLIIAGVALLFWWIAAAARRRQAE